MLDLWMDLPSWLRNGVAVLFLLAGALILYFASVRFGFALLGIGLVLLLVGEKSKSEKNGYRF